MTTVMILRRPAIAMPRIPRERRLNAAATMGFIEAGFQTMRPVVVTLAILVAAVNWATPAHADPASSSISSVLNTVGIGNNGPISSTIAQFGQSFCPMLVQPGSNFASSAAQMSGNGGLGGPIAGFLAGQAIQAECPAFMTSIANGQMPFPLSGGGNSNSLFGLPSAAPAAPQPFGSNLFGLPPAAPAAPQPFGSSLFGPPPAAPQPFGSNLFAPSPSPIPGL